MKEDELRKLSLETGEFTLSSGEVSNYYYNIKELYCKTPFVVLDYFRERITTEFDCIVSAELGGALIAVGLGIYYKKPVCILRKRESHPMRMYPHGKCLIVDDVKTTGNTIKRLEEWVEENGAEVSQVVVGIDRVEK